MTPLRQRMLDAMQLRGFSPRTCEAYVGAVAALARYWHQDPAALGTPQIDQYLLHLVRERKRSFSTVNQAASALKFLYQTVLDRPEMAARVPMARMPQRLPEVLSREELARLFAAVRQPRAAVFLKTAYASGLRLNELCHLRVADIDAAADRMCIRVVQGKGAKDRYVPLSPELLQLLRQWWRTLPPARRQPAADGGAAWLFASSRDSALPLLDQTAQRWYVAAARAAGITKCGGVHTLRHCWATHMLESGVDLYTLQQWMGHREIGTTTRYLRLVRPGATVGGHTPLSLLGALPAAPPVPSRRTAPEIAATASSRP